MIKVIQFTALAAILGLVGCHSAHDRMYEKKADSASSKSADAHKVDYTPSIDPKKEEKTAPAAKPVAFVKKVADTVVEDKKDPKKDADMKKVSDEKKADDKKADDKKAADMKKVSDEKKADDKKADDMKKVSDEKKEDKKDLPAKKGMY